MVGQTAGAASLEDHHRSHSLLRALCGRLHKIRVRRLTRGRVACCAACSMNHHASAAWWLGSHATPSPAPAPLTGAHPHSIPSLAHSVIVSTAIHHSCTCTLPGLVPTPHCPPASIEGPARAPHLTHATSPSPCAAGLKRMGHTSSPPALQRWDRGAEFQALHGLTGCAAGI